jgi:hypothetical protein
MKLSPKRVGGLAGAVAATAGAWSSRVAAGTMRLRRRSRVANCSSAHKVTTRRSSVNGP